MNVPLYQLSYPAMAEPADVSRAGRFKDHTSSMNFSSEALLRSADVIL